MKTKPPSFFNRYQHPFGHPSGPQKLLSLTLYIDLWQEGKLAPGENPRYSEKSVSALRFQPGTLCCLAQD
jgi:hypothetical protein